MKNLLNRFRNLIRRNAEVEEASSQKLPSLPEPLEENECDTFHHLSFAEI